MKTIVKQRLHGKTTELIRLANLKQLYIICPNKMQVSHVYKQATDMGLSIPFPITWYDFIHKNYYGKNIRGFVIDNLDMCVQQETVVPIEAVSLTGEKDDG